MRVRAQAKGRLGRGGSGLEVVNTKDRPAKVREGRGPRPSPCLSKAGRGYGYCSFRAPSPGEHAELRQTVRRAQACMAGPKKGLGQWAGPPEDDGHVIRGRGRPSEDNGPMILGGADRQRTTGISLEGGAGRQRTMGQAALAAIHL